ncbi:bone morphogenetic protein 7-like [Hippocampus zosterae]|uniref:bone morphogenetic protein 7-like n=1 Tax=Hippocampus zosterae TaxID=109293 RepID=UPI00223E0AB1|nr:bone morphogenetic protein 7-like [Hippocampus zosterae]
MSFAVVGVMALMCSSVVIAFVLQPSKQDDVMPEDSNSRCRSDSLQSIRKELLAALNLQTEPRLPEGAREQWRGSAERLKAVTVPSSSSSDDGRDTSGCCAETSEFSMTELGWNNWMIYPERVTLVHCTHCGQSASCRPQPNAPQRDLQVQAPCCQPTTQEAVPVMYMDEWNTVVITSMHLTRRCGCQATLQPPQE